MALLEAKRGGDNNFTAGEKEKLEYECAASGEFSRNCMKSVKKNNRHRHEPEQGPALTSSIPAPLSREEKEFYNIVLNSLDYYRRGVLLNLFRGELPSIDSRQQQADLALEQKKEQIKAELRRAQEEHNNQVKDSEEQDSQESDQGSGNKGSDNQELNHPLARVRFIHPTPSFVWKDLKVYGPFGHGEETEIFPEVAELLVRKRKSREDLTMNERQQQEFNCSFPIESEEVRRLKKIAV